jgi:hypothetical protein
MKVLVDFDNIPIQIRKQGSSYTVDRIFTALKPVLSQVNANELDFRLYGGWDENHGMSRMAQQLSADLRANFPKIVNSDHVQPSVPLRLSVSLAQSLEILPRNLLPNTLRSIPVQKEFNCTKPSKIGCANANCPINPLTDFLNTGACPVRGCLFTPAAVLKKLEQKLVDTMMVADMIYLARADNAAIAVVSSDDDMWPGILSGLVAGAQLIHIQTTGVKRVLPYKRNVNGTYVQLEI